MDRDALDRWITSGRYREEWLLVTCPECEEVTRVKATTEYGTAEWDPDRCSSCGSEFPEDVPYETEPEPEPPDDWPEPDGYRYLGDGHYGSTNR